MYANAQSVVGKVSELCSVAADLDPDVIMLTETWCNKDIQNALLKLPGYELIQDLRRDRSDTHLGIGGGILVYAKNNFSILPVDNGANSFNQFCIFKFFDGAENWTVILIYRPPSTTQDNTDQLARLIREAPTNTIIVGDFNLPGINWDILTADSKGRPVLEACADSGMTQLVSFATHIKGNMLDLVLTDVPEK